MDNNTVISIMFEEIKQLLKKLSDKAETNGQSTANIPNMPDIEGYINQSNEQLLSKLENIELAIVKPREGKIHHRISIDIKSSWVFLTIIGLSLLLITSLVFSYSLKKANDRINDNDLKYRYIKMQGSTDTKALLRLESSFTYNRNKDSILLIRKRVEVYERLVKEQAEKIERARLNASEAERLQKEVETVKNK